MVHDGSHCLESLKFSTERWLEPADEKEESPEDACDQREATLRTAIAPFDFSETRCLGRAVAYYETSMMMAKKLWKLDFTWARQAWERASRVDRTGGLKWTDINSTTSGYWVVTVLIWYSKQGQ